VLGLLLHTRQPASTIVAMNSLALLIWTLAAAEPQIYTDPVMHFTLNVPDGWALLSPQELAEVDEGHTKEHGAAPTKTDARMRPARLKPGALPFIAVSHLQCSPPTLETMRDGLSGVIDTGEMPCCSPRTGRNGTA
jgi:hypothetical protein